MTDRALRVARASWCAVCLIVVLAGGPDRRAHSEPETEPPDASHLDILLVADTADEEIGESVAADLGRMRHTLEMGVPEARRTITVLAGSSATPKAIRAHYTRRKPRPHEARLFFYAGHGVWAPQGPTLKMAGGQVLKRSALREIVAADHPRLAVFLTDCCSTYVGMAAAARVLIPDPETFRDLLFRSRGIADVTAAQEGQAAVGNGLEGGYFTTGIVEALTGVSRATIDEDRSGIVTWEELLRVVRGQTDSTFRRFHPEGLRVDGRLQRGQTPVAFGKLAQSMGVRIPRSKQRLGVTVEEAGGKGVRLVEIAPKTPAAWSGLRPGELLTALTWIDSGFQRRRAEITTVASIGAGLKQIPGARVITCIVHMPGEQTEWGDPRLREVLVHLSR